MIKFFKHIRKDLMEKGKTARYFKYAIGEITLVVLGILIALSLNNWNDKRKNQIYSSLVLKEIYKNLSEDMTLIYVGIEPRLQRKEDGIKHLKEHLYEKRATDILNLINDYSKSASGFTMTVNMSGYQSLNSKGTEIIRNDSLRNIIVEFYEIRLPRAIEFIHCDDTTLKQNLYDLENQIFKIETFKSKDDDIGFYREFLDEDIYNNQSFYKAVNLLADDTGHKRYRLNGIKQSYNQLMNTIGNELNERNIAIVKFDSIKVMRDF